MASLKKISAVDIDIALRLMEDDQTALEEVLLVYGPAIGAAMRSKYQFTAEDCEDILSIAVSRLWEARGSYDECKGSLRAYFYRIADNAARDVFKHGWYKARSREVVYGQDNDLDAIASEQPELDCELHEDPKRDRDERKKQEKVLRDLKEIVDSLPESQRHIIWSDACVRDDIADSGKLANELGIAIASVRVYRKRAMETIRKRMRERGHQVP